MITGISARRLYHISKASHNGHARCLRDVFKLSDYWVACLSEKYRDIISAGQRRQFASRQKLPQLSSHVDCTNATAVLLCGQMQDAGVEDVIIDFPRRDKGLSIMPFTFNLQLVLTVDTIISGDGLILFIVRAITCVKFDWL